MISTTRCCRKWKKGHKILVSLKKNTYDLTYSMLWKIFKKRFFEIQYYEAFPLFNFSTFRNFFCVLSDSCSVFFEPSTFPCIPHVAIQRIYVNAIFSMFLVLDARNLLEGPLTYTPGLAQGDSQFCWYWPTGCSSKVKSVFYIYMYAHTYIT